MALHLENILIDNCMQSRLHAESFLMSDHVIGIKSPCTILNVNQPMPCKTGERPLSTFVSVYFCCI